MNFSLKEKIVFALILLPLLGFGGCYGYSQMVYSRGHRDGYIYKFSTKGMFGTWEGELSMPGAGGRRNDIGNVWQFTVTDPEIIKKIDTLDASQFVRVHYKEYYWRPWWEGETNYRAYKVETLKGSQ